MLKAFISPFLPHTLSFFLDLTSRIMFGEECNFSIASICCLLQSPVTSATSDDKIWKQHLQIMYCTPKREKWTPISESQNRSGWSRGKMVFCRLMVRVSFRSSVTQLKFPINFLIISRRILEKYREICRGTHSANSYLHTLNKSLCAV
jgi:hypothetical protein